MKLKSLLLAGGHSSRMGFPKHLLRLPNGELLYRYLLNLISEVCPEQSTLYMSLKNHLALDYLLQEDRSVRLVSGDMLLFPGNIRYKVRVLYDEGSNSQNSTDAHKVVDIGPAAGLLAAYRSDLETCWLIVACDYPLLIASALKQLLNGFDGRVTCFQNEKGFCEPLLAVWSPNALQKLQDNTRRGNYGPSFVIRELNGKMIQAEREYWLFNANNKEEWNTTLELWLTEQSHCQKMDCEPAAH